MFLHVSLTLTFEDNAVQFSFSKVIVVDNQKRLITVSLDSIEEPAA